ncbi:MAG: hypothetical protein AAB426_14780 [Myxococcota bacterium]
MADDMKVVPASLVVATAPVAKEADASACDDAGIGAAALVCALEETADRGRRARESVVGAPAGGAKPTEPTTAVQVQKLFASYNRQFAPNNPSRPMHHTRAYLDGRATQRIDIASAADAAARLNEITATAPYDAIVGHISTPTPETKFVLELVLGSFAEARAQAKARAANDGISEAAALRTIYAEALTKVRSDTSGQDGHRAAMMGVESQVKAFAFLLKDDVASLERDLSRDMPDKLVEPDFRRKFEALNKDVDSLVAKVVARAEDPRADLVTIIAAVAQDWGDRIVMRDVIVKDSRTPPLGRK